MEQRKHKVSFNGHLVHCMCALDALAVSPMFNIKKHIDSSCETTGEKISIDQDNQAVINKNDNKDVPFAINWNAAAGNCCSTSLCTEMIFLKNEDTVKTWISEDPENRETFTVNEAIDFASRFFKPLLN